MATNQGIDLDGMTSAELTALIEAAESKLREKQEEAKATFMTEMQERARALGLSLNDLFGNTTAAPAGRKSRKDAGKPVAAKYRGPVGETWSGRGRPPRWLSEAEAQGKKREEFRI